MQKGVRDILKQKIPERYWPILRYFDKYIIDLLYIGYLFKRAVYQYRIPKALDMWQQSIFNFNSNILSKIGESKNLSGALKTFGFSVSEGRHSIYLGCSSEIRKINPTLENFYPHRFGLKIIKSLEMSSDGTPYYTSKKLAPASNTFTMRAIGSVNEKVVVSNLLSTKGVAPRVYDIIRLRSANSTYYALVVQHVEGKTVTGKEGLRFIKKLKQALGETGIDVLGIKNHKDFRPPDFRGNIVADNRGTYYVDIQNFVIFTDSYIKNFPWKIRNSAVKPKKVFSRLAPFRTKFFRFSRYSEGDEFRFISFQEFYDRHRLSFQQSCVLAAGDNAADFTMFALSKGARWCVIIVQPGMAEDVKTFLYYYGFSRFDVIEYRTSDHDGPLPLRKFEYIYYSSDKANGVIPALLTTLDSRSFLYEGHKLDQFDDMEKGLEALQAEWTVVWKWVNTKTSRPMMMVRFNVDNAQSGV